MKLLIAIPALNEEQSIEHVIERCIEARPIIIARSPVTSVDITVVSDGSTDRTAELAGRHGERIQLIVFPENRGYGAAIKEAWSRSDAELLGFIDADGTCDPEFFGELCASLSAADADVALGSRLKRGSGMPWLRRAGNAVFALMLSVFSSKRVRDTASGMRVVRAASVRELMPLPDGMHFTPAMSARAILNETLRIIEVPMPYHEREGRSKLHVVRDGLSFLRVILETAFLYRPSRPLGLAALGLAAVAAALMVMPTVHYLRHGALVEWMIYRFVVCSLLATVSCLLLSASYLCGRIVALTLGDRTLSGPTPKLGAFFQGRLFWLLPAALLAGGALLVMRSFLDLIATGHTSEHWSRFVVMAFFYQVAFVLLVTRAIDYVLGLISAQLLHLESLR